MPAAPEIQVGSRKEPVKAAMPLKPLHIPQANLDFLSEPLGCRGQRLGDALLGEAVKRRAARKDRQEPEGTNLCPPSHRSSDWPPVLPCRARSSSTLRRSRLLPSRETRTVRRINRIPSTPSPAATGSQIRGQEIAIINTTVVSAAYQSASAFARG